MLIFVWFRFENIKVGQFLKNFLFNLVFLATKCTFRSLRNFRGPRLMEHSNTSGGMVHQLSSLRTLFYWDGLQPCSASLVSWYKSALILSCIPSLLATSSGSSGYTFILKSTTSTLGTIAAPSPALDLGTSSNSVNTLLVTNGLGQYPWEFGGSHLLHNVLTINYFWLL